MFSEKVAVDLFYRATSLVSFCVDATVVWPGEMGQLKGCAGPKPILISIFLQAERAFKLFDKDNDGYITKQEFQKISKKLNKEQIDAVFNKFDKNGDGVLSFEEFRKMLNK